MTRRVSSAAMPEVEIKPQQYRGERPAEHFASYHASFIGRLALESARSHAVA